MTSINLGYNREDAKTLIKFAFENTRGIKTYNDSGTKIIGKTGASLGSYGEKVVVAIPENQAYHDQTTVNIHSEKEVDMNITANPQKYESRFLGSLNELRGYSIQELFNSNQNNITESTTKEVASANDQAGGKSLLIVVVIIVFIMFFFLSLLPLLTL